MAFQGGGLFGSGAKSSEQSGSNTIIPNAAVQASETSAPIINFNTTAAVSGKKAAANISGPEVAIYSQQTDYGALAAASNLSAGAINLAGATAEANLEVSKQALALGGAAIQSGQAVANAGLGAAQQAYGSSLNFAATSRDEAYNFQEEQTDSILEFAQESTRDIFEYAKKFVGDVITANQATTSSTITGLKELSARTTTSSDERVAEITKYALWLVGGVVAIVVLAPVFKEMK